VSYEGYREYKCRCGNVDCADVYDRQPPVCTSCGTPFYRIRSIDETNGRDVGEWRPVEYRSRFKDYVARGFGYDAEWFGPERNKRRSKHEN
jgi:hypothetical protein